MKFKSDYKPYKGFIDLSEYKMPSKIFKSLWKIQDYLSYVSKNKEYFKEFEPNQLKKCKELSAIYQQELFKYINL